jgi:hypothetical protein
MGAAHAAQHHAPGLHRLGDVLHPLPAHRREGKLQPLAQLLPDLARDAHPTWLRQALEASRHIDAIAVDVLALDDDVAGVDADAKRMR